MICGTKLPDNLRFSPELRAFLDEEIDNADARSRDTNYNIHESIQYYGDHDRYHTRQAIQKHNRKGDNLRTTARDRLKESRRTVPRDRPSPEQIAKRLEKLEIPRSEDDLLNLSKPTQNLLHIFAGIAALTTIFVLCGFFGSLYILSHGRGSALADLTEHSAIILFLFCGIAGTAATLIWWFRNRSR